MKYIIIFITLVFLSACQPTLIRSDNSFFETKSNPSIEITQRLEVLSNSARVFFQNGVPIHLNQLDLYSVNCELEINTVSEEVQFVEPGVFTITSINQDESSFVMMKPIMVASLNYATGVEQPVDIKRFYRFRLSPQKSESESQVRSLICRGVQARPSSAELPTLNEMQMAVGKYIIINL